MATYNFRHRSGDTWGGMGITVVNGTAPVDLTDATVKMQVRKQRADDPILSLDSDGHGISITDSTAGELTISPTIISSTEFGEYKYEVEFTLSDGSVKTWLSGLLTLQEDIVYV